MVRTDCYELNQALHSLFGDALEKWEDSLKCDSSEMIYVDGEEGDFGITKFFDAENVLMMVKYVKGGDDESSYFTAEGLSVVKQHLQNAMNGDGLDKALSTGLNPADGCYGFTLGCNVVQARRDQHALALRRMRAELKKMREEKT